MMITKRDGSEQEFDRQKIIDAVMAAGVDRQMSEAILDEFNVYYSCKTVEDIQDAVEKILIGFEMTDEAKAYIIFRHERTKLRDHRVHPDATALPDYVVTSKYARRGENWKDICIRNRDMHIRKYPQLKQEIIAVYDDFVIPKKVLPSMRSMQFAGKAIEENHCRMYNCSFSPCNRPRFFSEMLFLLLSGCGCGYSVQTHHVNQLPKIMKIPTAVRCHTVEDTIEGWANALQELVWSYTTGTCYMEFDYIEIREEGSDLFTSGGKAPGHIPLKKMLELVRGILTNAEGRHLESIEAHDICCLLADCVLAGGIRRASLIALFTRTDVKMLQAKTGEWWKTHPHRAMANNSAVILRDNIEHLDFLDLFTTMKEYGEPGFWFTDDTEYGTNPCAEIGLNPWMDGKAGWAFCNLTETNGSTVVSPGDFYDRCEASAFLGTLQAGYTDFPYLTSVSKKIAEREALLGCSNTGIMDNAILRDPEALKFGSLRIQGTNLKVAEQIGINPAARATTVKPAGTTSLVLGCMGSGHHAQPGRRYLRRITANPNEPAFKHFRSVNPHMCEEKPNGDWVITFPVEVSDDALIIDDHSAIAFIKEVMQTYLHWITPGTFDPQHSAGLTHNVSCTVRVKKDEWDGVANTIWHCRSGIAAMSFFPDDGDKKYDYAPREVIKTAEDELRWNALLDKYKPVDWDAYSGHGVDPLQIPACEGDKCEI